MKSFSKMKIYGAVIFCVFAFGFFVKPTFAEKKELSYKEKKDVDHMMRMVQMDTENLHIAFERRNWRMMEKLAQEIHDACAGLESRGDTDAPLEFDDFRLNTQKMHDSSEAIIDASKAKNLEEAKSAYKRMERACVDCHRIFRD